MAGSREVLQQGYAAFDQGDIETATAPWPDDFVWEGSNSPEIPGAGVRQGKGEALQALQEAVGAWDEFNLTVDEVVGDGDTLVVLGHAENRKGDQTVKQPVVHVWRFSGETPRRIQTLTDTLQAARALGVA